MISALAITEDRQQLADFTRNYYRGEDAVLAAPLSPITDIKTKADMATRRVGVPGYGLDTWMQKNLVDTNKMPSANLRHYKQAADAISDLKASRIDLVILDRLPADTYVSSGQAKPVGHSMYVQDYGIAVRQGSTLLPELNRVLAEVVADGTVNKLAEKYLAVPWIRCCPCRPRRRRPRSAHRGANGHTGALRLHGVPQGRDSGRPRRDPAAGGAAGPIVAQSLDCTE